MDGANYLEIMLNIVQKVYKRILNKRLKEVIEFQLEESSQSTNYKQLINSSMQYSLMLKKRLATSPNCVVVMKAVKVRC